MKKFPITSENGNEYLVKFEKLAIRIGWKCKLYEPVKIKGIKLFSIPVDTSYFDESWNSNFIEMSEKVISDYEYELEENQRQDKFANENKKKFKEWDGKL